MSSPDTLHLVCPHCHTTNRVALQHLSSAPDCGKCHQPLFTGQPVALDAASYDRHLSRSDLPLLVDFWAPWCGPCKAIGPVIDELAEEFEGKVVIAKMNVDDNPATPGKFGIRAIPTLILFKGGEVVDQITGAVGKTQLQDLIKKVI